MDLTRRAELAARAFEAIRARGVHRITMSDLAADLGLKRPTLYFYFPDLAAVFDAALEGTHRGWVEHVSARLIGVDHPIDLLIELARATVGFHQVQRDRIVLLFQLWSVGGNDPEQVISRGRALAGPLRAYLIERLADGLARGRVADCDPAAIVDLVLTVLDGALVSEVTRAAAVSTIIDELERRVLEPLRRDRDEGAHHDQAAVDRPAVRDAGGDGAPARRPLARRRRRR